MTEQNFEDHIRSGYGLFSLCMCGYWTRYCIYVSLIGQLMGYLITNKEEAIMRHSASIEALFASFGIKSVPIPAGSQWLSESVVGLDARVKMIAPNAYEFHHPVELRSDAYSVCNVRWDESAEEYIVLVQNEYCREWGISVSDLRILIGERNIFLGRIRDGITKTFGLVCYMIVRPLQWLAGWR